MAKLNETALCEKLVALETLANKQRVPFSLSMRALKKLLNQKRCTYSKRKFGLNGCSDPFQKTFDTIDPKKGFTDDNTIVCIGKYKDLRRDSVREIKRTLQNILNFKAAESK